MKKALFFIGRETVGSYGQSPEESDDDFYDEVERTCAYLTREAYRERGEKVVVDIEVREQ